MKPLLCFVVASAIAASANAQTRDQSEVVLGGVIYSTPDFLHLTDIIGPHCPREEREVHGSLRENACWYFDRATDEAVVIVAGDKRKVRRYQQRDLTMTPYARAKLFRPIPNNGR